MRTILCVFVIAVAPVAALAQSQLDRLQAVSDATSELGVRSMIDQMVANGAARAPLEAAIPDLTWNDEMRAAGACMLERYTELAGQDGVEQMLTRMEAFAEDFEGFDLSDPNAMEEMAFLPDGISYSDSAEITQSCGMMELQLQRMEQSGFSEAMMSAAQAAQ